MIQRQPTQTELTQARQWLERRIDAERSMTRNLGSLLKEAVKRVVEICFAYNVKPEVLKHGDIPQKMQWELNEVADWLKEAIYDYFVTLAIDVHKDKKDALWLFLFSDVYDNSFESILGRYTRDFIDELLILCGAGIMLEFGKKALLSSIGNNLYKPWNTPQLMDGLKKSDIPTYGRGRTNSMSTALKNLTKFGIGKSWMMARHLEATDRDAVGYMSFRNSSYPCTLCDSKTDRFYSIDDETGLPPYHNNCVCGTVYVDSKGEFIGF